MTLEDANRLLDKAKDGQRMPDDVIAEALFLTGDAGCWSDFPNADVELFVQALREAGHL
tara:strand:- start:150 stop:326 length:177 start_codon:yes stop_codon:yes gene_type:complete